MTVLENRTRWNINIMILMTTERVSNNLFAPFFNLYLITDRTERHKNKQLWGQNQAPVKWWFTDWLAPAVQNSSPSWKCVDSWTRCPQVLCHPSASSVRPVHMHHQHSGPTSMNIRHPAVTLHSPLNPTHAAPCCMATSCAGNVTGMTCQCQKIGEIWHSN